MFDTMESSQIYTNAVEWKPAVATRSVELFRTTNGPVPGKTDEGSFSYTRDGDMRVGIGNNQESSSDPLWAAMKIETDEYPSVYNGDSGTVAGVDAYMLGPPISSGNVFEAFDGVVADDGLTYTNAIRVPALPGIYMVSANARWAAGTFTPGTHTLTVAGTLYIPSTDSIQVTSYWADEPVSMHLIRHFFNGPGGGVQRTIRVGMTPLPTDSNGKLELAIVRLGDMDANPIASAPDWTTI